MITFGIFLVFLISTLNLLRPESEDSTKGPFECGFSAWRASRDLWSLRFFLLGVLFLIFDIELVILFPAVFVSEGPLWFYFMPLTAFLVLLLLGLLHEIHLGALEWSELCGRSLIRWLQTDLGARYRLLWRIWFGILQPFYFCILWRLGFYSPSGRITLW